MKFYVMQYGHWSMLSDALLTMQLASVYSPCAILLGCALGHNEEKRSNIEGHYQNDRFLYYIYSTIAKVTARQVIFLSQPSNFKIQISF